MQPHLTEGGQEGEEEQELGEGKEGEERQEGEAYLVIVHVQIVGRREDGDERREPRGLAFSVHSVARVLCLVCSDN